MQFEKLEELLKRIETTPDNKERQELFAIVSPILDFHRDALARVVEILKEQEADAVLDRVLSDPLLESLFRGYGLIDVSIEDRVTSALALARPLLERHGGDVHLVRMRGKVAELELTGNCHGCASSLTTMRNLIEKSLYEQVPELRGIEVAGLNAEHANSADWLPLVHRFELNEGEWVKVDLFGKDVLVCLIDEHPFVFDNRCPVGGEPLHEGTFGHLSIRCSGHELEFDLRTGVCVSDPRQRIVIYPSLIDDAVVRISYERDTATAG